METQSPKSSAGQKQIILDGFRLVQDADTNMTHRFTEIMVSPAAVLALLGEPAPNRTDGYKISKQWSFVKDGKAFTLYDWKVTNLWDPDLLSPDEFWTLTEKWELHIGSKEPATEEDACALAGALIAACEQ